MFQFSHYYCTRDRTTQPFMCLRMERSLQDADKKGSEFFKMHNNRDGMILFYRRFWPNWIVKYFIRKDISKYYMRMPRIINEFD